MNVPFALVMDVPFTLVMNVPFTLVTNKHFTWSRYCEPGPNECSLYDSNIPMNVPFTLVINNHLTCETHITPLASMNFLSIFPARIHSLSGGIACSLHRKVTSHHHGVGRVRLHVLYSKLEAVLRYAGMGARTFQSMLLLC
jgi:hypothetical protein